MVPLPQRVKLGGIEGPVQNVLFCCCFHSVYLCISISAISELLNGRPIKLMRAVIFINSSAVGCTKHV